MVDKSFGEALNDQIANEFAASMQYVGAAVHYDRETLPRLASFFYRQALEERDHAMMMVQFLIDTDQDVRIPDITSQQTRFDDAVSLVRMALEQEQRVGEEKNALFRLARETDEFRAEQFMQWFVKEQAEEVAADVRSAQCGRALPRQPAAGRGLPGAGAAWRGRLRPNRAADRRRRRVAAKPRARATGVPG